VIERSWGRWAIEVKTGDFGGRDLAGLAEFVRRFSGYRPLVLCDEPGISIAAAEKVRVRLLDHREFDAKIVETDAGTDIAVIKTNASGLEPAPLGDSDSAEVGEWVRRVGTS
jgi:hypothetical protein